MNTCFQIIVHFLVIFLNNLFVFNWQIIALQYCVGFCHTSKWISHRYTYITFLLNLLPLHHTPLHSFAKSNRSCLQKKKKKSKFLSWKKCHETHLSIFNWSRKAIKENQGSTSNIWVTFHPHYNSWYVLC